MSPILSPWLAQLAERRPFELPGDREADVAIVGAGIAGVSTAARVLRDTDHTVMLLDAGRIAHGATGHNAGQLVAEFERPLPDIAATYGLDMAVAAHAEVEGAWGILDDLIHAFSLRTPLHACPGFLGYSTAAQIRAHLDDMGIRNAHGLFLEPLLIAVGSEADGVVTAQDERFVTRVPHNVILERLRTEDASFIAAAVTRRGCMNSALFCEELVGSLLAAYPDRFFVAEHLPVREVALAHDGVTLRTDGPTVRAGSVVLCTNGFENFTIVNDGGPEIDGSFRRLVQGIIGYMGGYVDRLEQSPLAVVYFGKGHTHSDAYTYLTRRPYEDCGEPKALVCIGGPERFLPDGAAYDAQTPFPADVEEEIGRAFAATYGRRGEPEPERLFLWHGLMGYTSTGIRCVGKDPRNARLLYNLGCNGIGILPSIAGARRIARILAGHDLPPSIFDPAVQMSTHS